jgi:uncharacterized protein YndB with AHSA1/START domain
MTNEQTQRDGTLVEIDGKPALRFVRHYAHPMERVWRAISDPAEMRAWFPSNVEGERTLGAELAFVDDDQRQAAIDAGEPTRAEGPMFTGRVVVFDPPRVFSFTWGDELLRFELHEQGAGTRLVFTQVLSHQSVAARNGAGWHQCIGGLDALLGQSVPDEDWRAVYEDYLARIGPDLGTLIDGGGMRWERATHVEAAEVRAATSDPASWGGADHADEPLHWDVEERESGSILRLRHDAIGDDAQLAATWHALLIQLDMLLAAGELVPVPADLWVDAYAELLG